MQYKFDTYSYDGHGINGRDEYRTRLLTLTEAGKEANIGPTVAKLLDDSIAGYNGWKNYPTWCVNLWLENEEPLYREGLERVEETMTNPPHVSEYWNDEQTKRYNVADMLKDWVEEIVTESDNGQGGTESTQLVGMGADLIGYALGEVDWHEIADAWIGVVKEISAVER